MDIPVGAEALNGIQESADCRLNTKHAKSIKELPRIIVIGHYLAILLCGPVCIRVVASRRGQRRI